MIRARSSIRAPTPLHLWTTLMRLWIKELRVGLVIKELLKGFLCSNCTTCLSLISIILYVLSLSRLC